MSKRTVFTTITALPQGVSREIVIEFLHNHLEMIDLNPLVKERHPVKPPPHATPEEFHCIWYSLTDKISYLPGGLVTGDVSYTCAFHDLPNGLQTHCYAPLGLDIRDKWTLGGSLPGEPIQPVELGIGAPITGLYIREDVDMRCNMFMTSFVKKNLKRSHGVLVDRLKVKAQIATAAKINHSMSIRHSINSVTSDGGIGLGGIASPPLPNPHGSPDTMHRFPVRPESTTTTASAGSSHAPPPPLPSPDPTVQQFTGGARPNSPPQFVAPQGSVTWQSLKPSASPSSSSSQYSSSTSPVLGHGRRQPSFGNAPHQHYAHQPVHPHELAAPGAQGVYGQQQQQQQPQQQQYYQPYRMMHQQHQQQEPAELGGPDDNHDQAVQQGRRQGQPPAPPAKDLRVSTREGGNGKAIVAELEG